VNVYKVSKRNTKYENGKWIEVPFYEFKDEFPYGHGEKSVYLLSKFIKLTDEEAFAIRFHMGYSEYGNKAMIGDAFRKYPLAFALHVADSIASYYGGDSHE
jgi:hypothetical protein